MIFPTTVNGIPCQCRVLRYDPYLPAPMCGERLDPPEEEYFEFELLDRKGYPAGWLNRYLTPDLEDRLLSEYRKRMAEEICPV